MTARAARLGEAILTAAVPIALALIVNGILLALLGRDPFTFYADMFNRGLIEWEGFQESLIRSAPLLLIAAGLIVAFRANLWNLGGDGQFLLGAAFTAGFAPSLLESLGVWPMLLITMAIAMLAGGAWTLIPACAARPLRGQRDHHHADDVFHRHRGRQRAGQGAVPRPTSAASRAPTWSPSTSACRCSSTRASTSAS